MAKERIKPALVVLAAGIGSRYGGLKQLDAIGPSGETIIDYSIYDAIREGFGHIIFVINQRIEKDFRENIIDKLGRYIRMDFVHQEIGKIPDGVPVPPARKKPWGTGHAVLMAKDKVHGPFAVINADDFYGRGAFRALANYYRDWSPDRETDFAMVGFLIGNTLSRYGSVARGICHTDADSRLVDVVERTHVERTGIGITYLDESGKAVLIPENTVVSMNFWGFTPFFFHQLQTGFAIFIREHASDPNAEYFIPLPVNQLVKQRKATVRVVDCDEKWFGITYQEDRPDVIQNIRRLISAGVYPEKLWE